MREPTGPRDLPELRLSMIETWRNFYALHAAGSPQQARFAGNQQYSHLDPEADAHFLEQAELWWITPEMSRLVRHAAESLPPTTLTEDLIPKNKVVLAFFADPLLGTDAVLDDHQMRVPILLWYRCRLYWDRTDSDYISVSMYSATPQFEGVPFMPVGRTDWKYGTDTEAPTFAAEPTDQDAQRLASMAQDRRWLAALNLLVSQPLVEPTTVRITNKSKLRSYQKKTKLPHDVRLVDLRKAPTESTGDGEPRKVNWSHRWIVGADTGGFWKQVAYGPQQSLRRPQWILPFEKGPKNKPLVIKDTVRVVRPDA